VRRTLSAVRAIAGNDLRDLARQRATWVSLLIFPVVNIVLIVLLPGFLGKQEQLHQRTAHYTVATEAAPADVAALRSLLAPARLRVVASPDASKAVRTKHAHAGLVVPTGAGLTSLGTAQDDPVTLRAIALSTRGASRAAVGRLVATIEAYRSSVTATGVAARGLPPRVARPITVRPVDLADTARGSRLSLAALLPVLLLFPLMGTIGLAAQRVSGGKDQRVLEPLLLLPVPRSVVLAGKAVSGYAISAVTVPAIALPLFMGRFIAIGDAGRRVALPPSTVLAVVVIAFVLLAFLVALGACLGAAARTSAEMGSLLPFLTFPIIVLALTINYLDLHTQALLAMVPVLGPTLVARDVVAGTAHAADAVVAVVATLLCAAALVAVSGPMLERERSVLRATS
jgi:ABC-type Na+ efflux pump permease subunit